MSEQHFTGFPEAGLRFLEDLGTNNEKVWFEANKDVYKRELLEPAILFVTDLGERLQAIVPDIRYDTRTNGSGSSFGTLSFDRLRSPSKVEGLKASPERRPEGPKPNPVGRLFMKAIGLHE